VRERSPRTAIVVVSGLSSTGMAAKAVALGAVAYVEKGEVAAKLVDVVRAAGGDRTPATADVGS
jgi:FixJ family two-component response regulator